MDQPNRQPVGSPPASKRRFSLRQKLDIITWVAIVVALVAGVGIWYRHASASVVSREVAEAADFAVYSPRYAPAGFKAEQDETSLENGILTYKFSSQSEGTGIVVTVQQRPDGFNMSEISKGGSISSTAMDSGTLYNLSTGEIGQYLLDTGASLIYITSPDSIDTATINSLANSFRKIN